MADNFIVTENFFIKYLEVPEFMSVRFYNHINTDIVAIRSSLNVKGYEVEGFSPKSAKTDVKLVDVKGYINHIEEGLDIINKALKSDYYGQSVRYDSMAPSKEDVERWINILNDLHEKLGIN